LATDDRPGAGQLEVDRLIHEPARLSIMANLFVVESANATYLLQQTGLTWGNLGSHLARLETAGYVAIEKGYRGRKPNTMVALTDEGRAAFRRYRAAMRQALGGLTD
jgi:DNA-binding MarR family transcriptional regulator